MITTIKGSMGEKILVDDFNFEWLNRYLWSCLDNGYVYRTAPYGTVYLAREIYGKKIGRKLDRNDEIDHKDLNKLNNQVDNLRFCDRSLNIFHRPKFKGIYKSKYKGVTFKNDQQRAKPWRSRITLYGKTNMRYFRIEIGAAKWYNKMALILGGQFAVLNKIEEIK